MGENPPPQKTKECKSRLKKIHHVLNSGKKLTLVQGFSIMSIYFILERDMGW